MRDALGSGAAGRPGPGRLVSSLFDGLVYSVVVAVSSLVALAPMRPVLAAAGGIGRWYARLGLPRSADARRNLELAFPDWSDDCRQAVLIACFDHWARTIVELALVQGRHRQALLATVQIEGIETLERAQASERAAGRPGGVVVIGAHLGSWDLAGIALAQAGLRLAAVYNPLGNPLLDRRLARIRASGGMQLLSTGRAGLGAARALREGRTLILLADQNAPRAEGAFAPFFGVQASTRTGPVLLARAAGAPMLTGFAYRDRETGAHRVRVGGPIELESAADDPDEAALASDCARVNAAIEAAIREAPEQWLWPHRRFRTRPEGEPSLYPRRRGPLRRLRRWLRRARSS